MELPSNAKQSWWNGLIQRLQQVASGNKTYAIITITVIVNENGDPVFWKTPNVEKFEPKSRSKEFLDKIISTP